MSLHLHTRTEGLHPFEVVLRPVGDTIAYDPVIIASGQNLAAGSVLGRITASGKYALHDAGKSDGTEVAAAVLLANCNASTADTSALAVVRLAEVKQELLVFKAGATQQHKDDALAALAAHFIIAR